MEMPTSTTVGDLIDEIAGRSPTATAVITEEEVLSYGDLQARALELARGLLDLGVSRGDPVALLMGNRVEWIVASLALAKLGALVVPLNTWHQPDELLWTLRHVGATVLIAEARFLKRDYAAELMDMLPGLRHAEAGQLRDPLVPSLSAVVLFGARRPGTFTWDELRDLGRERPASEVARAQAQVTGEDPLYVLYTSGSTAEPKGAVLRHLPTVRNCFEIGERRAFDSSDRVWFASPLFYAFGAVNCLPATLTHGATLVLQRRFHPDRAIDLIEKHECSVFYATSNIIRSVYECSSFSKARTGSLKKGAAGISPAERRIALVEMGIHMATQSFGLTEVYGHCALGYPDDPVETKLTTEGTPLSGFEFKIVDPESRRPLTRGEVGLLLVRGYTTKEYLHSELETSLAIDDEGFFSTGDLGHMGEDGYFRFQARLKEVIKTSGINVSPFEVEQILLRHPAVRQAYVVGVPEERRGEAAVAFVEVGAEVTEEELRAFVRDSSASFKVPARVLFRTGDHFPRLASGKVPRYRLRDEARTELAEEDH